MFVKMRFFAKKFFVPPLKLAKIRTFCLFLYRIFVLYVQQE